LLQKLERKVGWTQVTDKDRKDISPKGEEIRTKTKNKRKNRKIEWAQVTDKERGET